MMQLLPTPESPINMSFIVASYCFVEIDDSRVTIFMFFSSTSYLKEVFIFIKMIEFSVNKLNLTGKWIVTILTMMKMLHLKRRASK